MDIGKLFIVGLLGTSLSEKEKELLSNLKPLGIILFKRNFSSHVHWQADLKALIDDCKSCTGDEKLIVSIDHEGGRVHRLPHPVTHFGPASTWGKKSYEVGSAMGKELRALGFSIDYAPVVDVLTESQNIVIGDRAFGDTPDVVIERSKIFLEGLQTQGVLGCIKHFPGHGATVLDSHLELPKYEKTEAQLRTVDLLPFVELLDKVSLIMTAHIVYPCLDNIFPATLSKRILSQLLREELGYQGAVISDALEMKALNNTALSDKAVLSLRAGVDILLCAEPQNSTSPVEFAAQLAKEVEQSDIKADFKRIEALQDIIDQITRDIPASSLTVVGSAEHSNLSQSLKLA